MNAQWSDSLGTYYNEFSFFPANIVLTIFIRVTVYVLINMLLTFTCISCICQLISITIFKGTVPVNVVSITIRDCTRNFK